MSIQPVIPVSPGFKPAVTPAPSPSEPAFGGWLPERAVVVQDRYGRKHTIPESQLRRYTGGGGPDGDDEDPIKQLLTKAARTVRHWLRSIGL